MKRRIIYGGVTLGLVCIGAFSYVVFASQQTYEVTKATSGSIEEKVVGDGDIITNQETTYYATVTAPIKNMTLKIGDTVTKGEEIYKYNTEDLETAYTRATLQQRIVETNQDAVLEQNAKLENKLAEAKSDYEIACAYVDFFQESVDGFEDQLYQVALEKEIYTKLQADVSRKQAFATHELQDPEGDTDDLETANDNLLNDTLKLNEQEKKIASYDTASIEECMADCQQELTFWKEEKAKEESKKDADDATLTPNGIGNAKAYKESSSFETEEAQKELEKAEEACKVKENGVVTEIFVKDGETVVDGAPIVTIADKSDLAVRVAISKYDIDQIEIGQKATVSIGQHTYNATVSRIDQVAQQDDANKPKIYVEATLEELDEAVYIGLEADVTITTNEIEETCIVPQTAIYTLDDGTYVFQVIDQKLRQTEVTIGSSDGVNTEIIEGIQVGDEVITSAVSIEDIGKTAKTQ